jgi:Tol biopolymer transport system component
MRFRRRRVGPALVAAGALALPLAAVGADDARKPIGELVFTARVETFGPGDVYVVRADGSRLRQLTDTSVSEQGATWAPDGKSIAFIRLTGKGALYRLFLNRTKPRLLYRETSSASGFMLDPTWSPDGRRIAFTSQRPGGPAIWTIGLDGTLTQVTKAFGVSPTWSPDGRRLAYAGLNGISVVGREGRGNRALLNTSRTDGFPVWSPDGKWIAIRNNPVGHRHEIGSLDLVNPAGTVRKRLRKGGLLPVSWSPRSDAVLAVKGIGKPPNSQSQLFIVPLGRGRPRPVAGTYGAGGASWHR